MKKSKGIKNVIWGLAYQLITIAFGLILPRMFITSYGSEVNGLISSVNQIYVYVALLEAGIGTASLQALYKTIGEGNLEDTNAVMAATSKFYKKTGIYYLIAVLVFAGVYPLVVNSDIDTFTIIAIILLNGLGGVINYFFQGKFRILLRADGRNYVLSNLSSIIYICSSFTKIIMIQLGFHVVWVHVGYLVFNIAQMIFIYAYVKKTYKWLDLSVEPNYEALSGKKSVMVHQVSSLVFSNTDVLILTFASGLKTVSVYSMYNSFYNMVKSVLYSFLEGVQFALGQTFNTDFKRFLKLQDIFETCYMTLTFMFYTILYILIEPFLTIYTEGITDIQYVDSILPIMFTIVFLLQGARGPMQLVAEYAKHFKQTQNQAIIEMVINLSVTFVCVYKFGIYGVLCGTIAALLYRANAMIIYTNKNILNRSCVVTYYRWLWRFGIFIIFYMINKHIELNTSSYIQFIISAIPLCFIICLLYLIGMCIFERNIVKALVDERHFFFKK